MNSLQPLETMERIPQEALEKHLETILERIDRENIGFVITRDGADEMVICPSAWLGMDEDEIIDSPDRT